MGTPPSRSSAAACRAIVAERNETFACWYLTPADRIKHAEQLSLQWAEVRGTGRKRLAWPRSMRYDADEAISMLIRRS
jgi:hypothetical protein